MAREYTEHELYRIEQADRWCKAVAAMRHRRDKARAEYLDAMVPAYKSAGNFTGGSRPRGGHADPTHNAAVRLERASKRLDAAELAFREAAAEILEAANRADAGIRATHTEGDLSNATVRIPCITSYVITDVIYGLNAHSRDAKAAKLELYGFTPPPYRDPRPKAL